MSDFSISERPQSIEQIVGNDVIKNKLQSAIANNKLSQTIMFIGKSGCGKSTFVNCLLNELAIDELDIKYIDCGLMCNMETARTVCETINTVPFGGRTHKKAIILEEVHKLSQSKKVQESFLYTLEHLAEFVYIFATTTNPEVLLPQFINRFTKYEVKPLTKEEILYKLIKSTMIKYNFKVGKSIATKIAEVSDGCPREAMRLLYSIHTLPVEQQVIEDKIVYEENPQLFDIVQRLLYGKNSTLKDYKEILSDFQKLEMPYEAIRHGIIAILEYVIKNPRNCTDMDVACTLIEAMESPCIEEGLSVFGKNLWKFIRNMSC